MRWYVSIAAINCYQRIAGYPIESDGELFDRAERELADLCEESRLRRVDGNGRQDWRVKATIRVKRTRLELVVSTLKREEGNLPQLVHIRAGG